MGEVIRTNVLAPTRFNVAVHALVLLAKDGDVCPSSELADRIDSHATFVRRIIAHLVKAGIVQAKQGRGGGYILARPPEKITLGQVSRAIKGLETEQSPGCVEECPPTGDWTTVLAEIVDEAEALMLETLDRYTLADLLRGELAG